MDSRSWFSAASAGLQALLPGLDGCLDCPGLGEWSVRDLLGHTCRACLTLESYLAAGSELDDRTPVDIASAVEYYRAAVGTLAEPSAVTHRGREAGAALGDDPIGAALDIVDRVGSVLDRAADDALVATPLGTMRVSAYLPTRSFELSVHSVDLARASGQEPPGVLLSTLSDCLSLVAALADDRQRLELLLAATGREGLPGAFSVV